MPLKWACHRSSNHKHTHRPSSHDSTTLTKFSRGGDHASPTQTQSQSLPKVCVLRNFGWVVALLSYGNCSDSFAKSLWVKRLTRLCRGHLLPGCKSLSWSLVSLALSFLLLMLCFVVVAVFADIDPITKLTSFSRRFSLQSSKAISMA